MEKIFGFALTKTMNTDKAEELASRITFDVYVSLLKVDNVQNIAGYIYRVACNVYARFVDEEVKGRYISLNEVNLPSHENDFVDRVEKDETYIRLRSVISYLGKTQREIVVMHYFEKLKQYEIAERLKIPLGTVKWHLHDARNQIMEGMNKMHEKVTLGLKPIKFTSMGLSGYLAPNSKSTEYYLSKLISQNVAYAAYREAKTITEIAGELGVPTAFIEDEVAYLEDNGFMDRIAGGKYLTNILIKEPLKEILEKEHKIYTHYAKIACTQYVPLVFDAMQDYKPKGIYSPEDDFNFLMWSAVSYACGIKFRIGENSDLSKYNVKRKDGGDFIALASVNADIDWESLGYKPELYYSNGDMNFGCMDQYPVHGWQINTFYDNRNGLSGYQDNIISHFAYLYEFMTGKITKDAVHADKFKQLFDKGYLVSKGNSEYVNMVVSTMMYEGFPNMLPAIPNELKAISEELDDEIFRINKNQYPQHIQNVYRAWNTNCLSNNEIRTRILEQLTTDGTLKPLNEIQKHSVNTIMFCDVLPK